MLLSAAGWATSAKADRTLRFQPRKGWRGFGRSITNPRSGWRPLIHEHLLESTGEGLRTKHFDRCVAKAVTLFEGSRTLVSTDPRVRGLTRGYTPASRSGICRSTLDCPRDSKATPSSSSKTGATTGVPLVHNAVMP
jgi:hypothetical protein